MAADVLIVVRSQFFNFQKTSIFANKIKWFLQNNIESNTCLRTFKIYDVRSTEKIKTIVAVLIWKQYLILWNIIQKGWHIMLHIHMIHGYQTVLKIWKWNWKHSMKTQKWYSSPILSQKHHFFRNRLLKDCLSDSAGNTKCKVISKISELHIL